MEVKTLMRQLQADGLIVTSCGGLDRFPGITALFEQPTDWAEVCMPSIHRPHPDQANPALFVSNHHQTLILSYSNLESKDRSLDEGERNDPYFPLPGEEDLVAF
jgi:hypothetical protein